MARAPIEGIDFVLDEQGRRIFTRAYLLSLGYCCRSDCQNCPYQSQSLDYEDAGEEENNSAA